MNGNASPAADDRRFLKIYGLERSGTNYLEWVIRQWFVNVRVLVDELGWKHGPIRAAVDWTGDDWSDPAWPDEQRSRHARARMNRLCLQWDALRSAVADGAVSRCAIVKDPYAWVSSFSSYKGVPCSPVDPQQILRWNAVNADYASYVGRHPDASKMVLYEDLLLDPRRIADGIGLSFKLVKSSAGRIVSDFTMTTAGRPGRARFDRSRYATGSFMSGYTRADRDVFSDLLDRDLMAELGYALR